MGIKFIRQKDLKQILFTNPENSRESQDTNGDLLIKHFLNVFYSYYFLGLFRFMYNYKQYMT